jgi:hypothetical protein
VEVNVEVHQPAEPLHEGDGAGPRGGMVEAAGVEIYRDADQTERLLHDQELASWVIQLTPP